MRAFALLGCAAFSVTCWIASGAVTAEVAHVLQHVAAALP